MYKALFSCQRSFSCSCSISVHPIWLSLDCILVDFMQKINIFKNRAAESESLEQRAVTLFKFNKMLEDCVHIDSPEKKNDSSKSFYWMITNPQIKCWIQFCILKKRDECYIAGFAIFYRRCQLFIIFTICSPRDSIVTGGRGLEKLKCTLHGCSMNL